MSKVVLVTGAAKRAGKAFVEYFARKGFDVVVHYGRSATDAEAVVDVVRQTGQRAIAVHADLSSAGQITKLVDETYEAFGRLDLLVNNASVFGQDHFPDFLTDNLDVSIAVNYRAPILLTQAFYRKARAQGAAGVVINVVDQKVKGNFHRDHFSYTVGKVGIGNMTAMLAISAAPVLRVNAVFPGLMLQSDDQTQEDFEYASRNATPLGRIATPEDVAQAIALLTSPAYNGFDFVIDGGQNLSRVGQDVLYQYRARHDASASASDAAQ
jgi:pteridine reductase